MRTRSLQSISLVLTASVLAPPSLGQSALLREGDPDPSGVVGQTIENIGEVSINQSGGFGVSYQTEGTSGDVSGFWGSLTAGPGGVLREQSTAGTFDQTGLDESFGMSASGLAYVAQVVPLGGGSNEESIWLDGTVVSVASDPLPSSTLVWSFFTNAGVTEGGTPYFVAGLDDAQGGNAGRGLFTGTTPTAMFQTGDVVPGLPFPLSVSAVDFNFDFSANGTHVMSEVDMDSPSAANDRALTIDGSGLFLGGSLVHEDSPVPASIGGLPGESWDNFDAYAITDAGDYMFTGDTNGNVNTDEFIARNGMIWRREGDVIDGEVVSGDIDGATLSEGGNIAYIWEIATGGTTAEALFYETSLLLQEGDPVDWDGDGVIDANTSIEDFIGLGSDGMALTNSGTLYFLAEVNVNGVLLVGYLEMQVALDVSRFCSPAVPNTTGVPGTINAVGSIVATDNDLILVASDLPNGEFAYFLASRFPGFIANPNGSQGNLCVIGNIARFNAQVGQVMGGSVSITVDLTDIPEPPTFSATAMAGETWNFQCWHRDFILGQGPTSNFTDAIAITFQ